MKTLKYSRQRESIKANLMSRHDHPTADALYASIREEFPNISLGTVYRNLNLLVETGEILKLTCGNGPDHYDGNAAPHYHFVCRECGQVYDMDLDENLLMDEFFCGVYGPAAAPPPWGQARRGKQHPQPQPCHDRKEREAPPPYGHHRAGGAGAGHRGRRSGAVVVL